MLTLSATTKNSAFLLQTGRVDISSRAVAHANIVHNKAECKRIFKKKSVSRMQCCTAVVFIIFVHVNFQNDKVPI